VILNLYKNLKHIKNAEFRKKCKSFIDNHVSKYYNVDVDEYYINYYKISVINVLFGFKNENSEDEISYVEKFLNHKQKEQKDKIDKTQSGAIHIANKSKDEGKHLQDSNNSKKISNSSNGTPDNAESNTKKNRHQKSM